MRLFNPIARKLYLRIWLAVAGSVAVLSLVVGWAWQKADEQRDRERLNAPPREVTVRNAAGDVIGTAEAQPRRLQTPAGGPPGFEFVVTLADGQVLNLQMPPRNRSRTASGGRRAGDPVLAWLRPPYGFLWVLGLAGLAALCVLLTVPAWAERADRDKPMNIEADALARAICRRACPRAGTTKWPTCRAASTTPPSACRR